MAGDCCVFKFLRGSVERKHLMRFQCEVFTAYCGRGVRSTRLLSQARLWTRLNPCCPLAHALQQSLWRPKNGVRADLGGGCRGCAPLPPWDEAFIFAFKICLPHRSVTSFLRGAPPPKKNHGSAPGCGRKVALIRGDHYLRFAVAD